MRSIKHSFRFQDQYAALAYCEVTGTPYAYFFEEDEPTESGIFLKAGFELTPNDKKVLNTLMGYL